MGKTIDQWAFDYYLLQRYSNLSYRCYFKKIYVNNLANMPRHESVILAPNHQCALIDALAFVYSTKCQPVFLARADVFKGRLSIRFLTYLNIAPIYRMRDGASSVLKNEEVFENTISILMNKHNPLCMFPEGTHGDKRRLRGLKKGIFRIAFMAQEAYKDKPGVKIVPVGIDYSHYRNFHASQLINYGKPIEVSEYYDIYTENNNEGINQLKERLEKEIRKLMIDIQTEEYYDLYQNLRIVYNADMRKKFNIKGNTHLDRFNADKKMIAILDKYLDENPDEISSLNQKMNKYTAGLKQLNLRDWVLKREKYSLLSRIAESAILLTLSPLYILGLINNYIPYKIPVRFIRKIKDPQFHSSFKLVLAMITFPLYYIILIVLALIFVDPLWLKLAYIISIPLSGIFAFKYYIRVKKLYARFRYSRLVSIKDITILQLKKLRADIIEHMNKITEHKND
jgi:1-acyl-sn-glycerol-3-phosphate acyltransferase